MIFTRHVYFGSIAGHGKGGSYLVPTNLADDEVFFSDRYRDKGDCFKVPREALLDFEAGGDFRPLIDYLAETYSSTCPWLADAVSRVVSALPSRPETVSDQRRDRGQSARRADARC